MARVPDSVSPVIPACRVAESETSTERLAGRYLSPSSYGDSRLSPFARHFCAPSREALVARVELVDRLYKSGALADEVEKLGISREWLEKLHTEPFRVVIAEQPQPLPSLYSPLDEYGAPIELQDTLAEMVAIRDLVESRCCEPVGTGFLVSSHHGVSFNGISFGGYFIVPQEGKEACLRINLFTKEEKRAYEHVSYGDLRVALRQGEVVREQLEKMSLLAQGAYIRANGALKKQADYNKSRISAGFELTSEQEERLLGLVQQRSSSALVTASAHGLLHDWKAAWSESQKCSDESDSVSYIALMSALNRRLAKRIEPDLEFETFKNDIIDELPSTGVNNWPKFVGALLEVGLLEIGDPLLRIRTVTADGKIKFFNGRLRDVRDERVLIGIMSNGDGSETVVNVESLVADSRSAIARGDVPIITPCADIRILLNLGFSKSIILYDGAPYPRVMKAVSALRDETVMTNPREPKLHSYSRLWQYRSSDSSNPWAGLREKHTTLDYYAIAMGRDLSQQFAQ